MFWILHIRTKFMYCTRIGYRKTTVWPLAALPEEAVHAAEFEGAAYHRGGERAADPTWTRAARSFCTASSALPSVEIPSKTWSGNEVQWQAALVCSRRRSARRASAVPTGRARASTRARARVPTEAVPILFRTPLLLIRRITIGTEYGGAKYHYGHLVRLPLMLCWRRQPSECRRRCR